MELRKKPNRKFELNNVRSNAWYLYHSTGDKHHSRMKCVSSSYIDAGCQHCEQQEQLRVCVKRTTAATMFMSRIEALHVRTKNTLPLSATIFYGYKNRIETILNYLLRKHICHESHEKRYTMAFGNE